MKSERRTPRRIILLVAAAAMLAMSACNTVSGVGKDLQEASDNVKDAMEN